MKETDYVGLSHFQEFCKDLDEHYVVVGGFATLMFDFIESLLNSHSPKKDRKPSMKKNYYNDMFLSL